VGVCVPTEILKYNPGRPAVSRISLTASQPLDCSSTCEREGLTPREPPTNIRGTEPPIRTSLPDTEPARSAAQGVGVSWGAGMDGDYADPIGMPERSAEVWPPPGTRDGTYRERKFKCIQWRRHDAKVTQDSLEMRREFGPCGWDVCRQSEGIGISHGDIGRLRATWSNASIVKPLQFIWEGAVFALIYVLIESGKVNEDTLVVDSCSGVDDDGNGVSDSVEYQNCLARTTVGVNLPALEEKALEDDIKSRRWWALGILGGWFVWRLVNWIIFRTALLEVSARGVPPGDAWVSFNKRRREDLLYAVLSQMYTALGVPRTEMVADRTGKKEKLIDPRLTPQMHWKQSGQTLSFSQHHFMTLVLKGAVCCCDFLRGNEVIVAPFRKTRWLHLSKAGHTFRGMVLSVLSLGLVFGVLTFCTIRFLLQLTLSREDSTIATLSGLGGGALLGLIMWMCSSHTFAEFSVDYEDTSNTAACKAASGIEAQTIITLIPEGTADDIKEQFIERMVQPHPVSRTVLKSFFGKTGDSLSRSILTVFEDRIELDIKTYSIWHKCNCSCRYCEREESYVALLRDVEYVKCAYIGAPVLHWFGWFLAFFGFFQWGFIPFALQNWGSKLGDHAAALDYEEQQKSLLITLVVCEGLAVLSWLWYIWRKKAVLHIGIRPGGGDHGQINPFGSSSPFFIVFKPLKEHPEDKVMSEIMRQRQIAIETAKLDPPEPRKPDPEPEPEPQPTLRMTTPPRQPRKRKDVKWQDAPNAHELPMVRTPTHPLLVTGMCFAPRASRLAPRALPHGDGSQPRTFCDTGDDKTLFLQRANRPGSASPTTRAEPTTLTHRHANHSGRCRRR
jgi:hypothetical protein